MLTRVVALALLLAASLALVPAAAIGALTPTLSQGEREADNLPPLPFGDGWGESSPGLGERVLSDPIRMLSQSADNRFPASIRFGLKAEADAPITAATVCYRVGDQAITSFAPAEVKPARSISAQRDLDLRRFYMPPGVELRYQWRLEDEAGHKLATPWQTFTLDDPRFQWQVVNAGHVEIRWYRGLDSFGEALRQPALRALEQLRAEAGVEVTRTVKVYIYGSEADFQSAVDPGTHEWAGGRAFPREGVILIAAPPTSLDFARRTVPHELSHVVVYQATKNPYGGLPTWLDEGLAMLAEGDLQPSFSRTLQAAVKADRLISVWALSSNFPTDSKQAELSYAESYSLVRFVVDRYGQAGLSRLLAEFREGSTYDDALRSALGVDTYGLDDAWRASLGLKPMLAPAATASPAPTRAAPAPAAVPTAVRATATTAPAPTAPPSPTAAPLVATTEVSPAPAATPQPAGAAAPVGGQAGCAVPAGLLVVGGALVALKPRGLSKRG